MPRAAQETRQWSALLERELLRWPAVTAKPMFGCLALYRAARIFAVLPRTRALGTACSVNFKLRRRPEKWKSELQNDERVRAEKPGAQWVVFELRSDQDLNDALRWFERAYKQAGSTAQR